MKDEIPLKLPAFMIGNNNIEETFNKVFGGNGIDKHISWMDHVRVVENQIAVTLLRKPVSQ